MQAHGATTRSTAFGPITVEYDSRVLTPRPWTLGQSLWAAELARALPAGGRLLELCAGAGQIGLAAAVLADRDLVQVELDPVAAGFAADNARRNGWQDRVEIRTMPLEDAVQAGELFALILADPPYLPTAATTRWPEDPLRAIDGGPDGTALIRACLKIGADHLGDDGTMLLQVAGPAQGDQVDQLLRTTPEWHLRAGELRVTDAERAVLRIDRR